VGPAGAGGPATPPVQGPGGAAGIGRQPRGWCATVTGMASRQGIATFGAILLAHAAVTMLTWRDIRHRPAAQVRGSKRAWRIVSALNTGGSLAYLVLGRRKAHDS